MKPQEIELWARDIVESVLNNQPVEDSRLEFNLEISKIPDQTDGYKFFGALSRDQEFSNALNRRCN